MRCPDESRPSYQSSALQPKENFNQELTRADIGRDDSDGAKRSQSTKDQLIGQNGENAPVAWPVSEGAVFRRIVRSQVSFMLNGKRIKQPCWQALIRVIYTKALDGNSSAARLLSQFRKRFPEDLPAGDPATYIITPEDLRL
jgi:hypothetical protein